MRVKRIIATALICVFVGSSAEEPQPNAGAAAGSQPSALTAETSPNTPTLTLAVNPCYFHVRAGHAVFGWPVERDIRGKQEKVEVKIGFGASVTLVGTRQIKLLSPDAEGVMRTKEGRLAAYAGVTAPFIAGDAANQPDARTNSYTQVIDSYMMPLPAAAETIIGPRVYEMDGVRLETKGVALRHVPCGKFEACCVSSEDFRVGTEGFVKVAFLQNPPDAPNRKPNGPHASIDVLLDGEPVAIKTGGVGGESYHSAFKTFSPKHPGKLSVKAQYGTESCTIDLGTVAQ